MALERFAGCHRVRLPRLSRNAFPSHELLHPALLVPRRLDEADSEAHARHYVRTWLCLHCEEIRSSAGIWRIDQRSIAGAIAWEALHNPLTKGKYRFSRSSGPAKVHYRSSRVWEGWPVARQIEREGYLPQRTMKERRETLNDASGAIRYVGAIMGAFADIAASSPGRYCIRCRPEILANAYQGDDLTSFRQKMAAKKPYDVLLPGNPMAIWVADNLEYLSSSIAVVHDNATERTIPHSTSVEALGLREATRYRTVTPPASHHGCQCRYSLHAQYP